MTEDGTVLASAFQCTGLTHSRTLMPMVEDMLRNAELSMARDRRRGGGGRSRLLHRHPHRHRRRQGPGLGQGQFPAPAYPPWRPWPTSLAHTDALVVCAMDARRSQVYNALFRAHFGTLTRLTPDRAISLEDLAEELRGMDGDKNRPGRRRCAVPGCPGKEPGPLPSGAAPSAARKTPWAWR